MLEAAGIDRDRASGAGLRPGPERGRSRIHLADTYGFGHYSIELHPALARAQLDAGHPKAVLQRARGVFDCSAHPECQYAWGEADALHLCGVAHARLGELDVARQRLTAALAKREQLTTRTRRNSRETGST